MNYQTLVKVPFLNNVTQSYVLLKAFEALSIVIWDLRPQY
jgi:hypothetical protein